MSRTLAFLTLCDMSMTPHYDYALPCLAAAGWDISVIAVGAKEGVRKKTMPYPCRIVDLPAIGRTSRSHYEWSVMKTLIGLRLSRYDVVYVHSQAAAVRMAPLWAMPLKAHRFVYHSCDQYCPIIYPKYSRLEGVASRQARLYLSTEFHRAYWSRDRYRLKCPVLAIPPNLSKNWPIPPISAAKRAELAGPAGDKAFVLLLHGGFGPIRMGPQLVEALSYLPPEFRLALTSGTGPVPALDKMIAQYQLQDRILKLPPFPFNEMLTYTVNADAGVLLYQNTDFGNFFTSPGRLTEYISCGTPVVGSNYTGLENLILKYKLGVAANAMSPRELAAGILALRESIRGGEITRTAVRQAFESHFAFDHWEPQVVEAFDRLMTGPRRRELSPPPFPWMPKP